MAHGVPMNRVFFLRVALTGPRFVAMNSELGLNAINGYHSAMGIYYHVLK